jgi:hypothetical protein
LLFDRAKSADLLVDAHQVLAEFLESMEFGDFVLRLAQRGRVGEGLGHALAGDSPGQPKLRVVARIVGFGAMARWLAAATHYGCDRTRPEVAKAEEILQEFGSIRFQSVDGVRHKFSSERYYTFRNAAQKKKTRHPRFTRRPPPDWFRCA